MTDTEAKALALLNEIEVERYSFARMKEIRRSVYILDEAICRVIERLEATKARHAVELREQAERFDAFRQEVSDVLEDVRDNTAYDVHPKLWRFIIAKPDPLAEVLKEADAPSLGDDGYEAMAERVHAAMQARGYEWRKIGEARE